MFKVVIMSYEDSKIIKEFESCQSERTAETIERGININLNHDEYYTEIVPVD